VTDEPALAFCSSVALKKRTASALMICATSSEDTPVRGTLVAVTAKPASDDTSA
jgi:hypothetical protein